MRSAERFLLGALLCAACEREPRALPPPPPHIPTPTHYLAETFVTTRARCQLASVEPALTEPRARPIGRAAADLSVVDASLRCEDAAGQPVPARTLPLQLSWLDELGARHSLSTRSVLSEQQPEHAVFEVPAGVAGLSLTRRYQASSGEPLGAREKRSARLLVDELDVTGESTAQHVIAPWPRLHDRALDSFLDRLARTLASGAPFDTLSDTDLGHAAIRSAAELYQRIASRATLLVVRGLALREGQPRVTLALERGAEQLASFHFELGVVSGEPRVLRLLDAEASRASVQCAEDRSELALRAEQAQTARGSEPNDCNALGVLLPGRCQDADRALLRDALRVGSRCGDHGALGLDPAGDRTPPADFELRMRRGRSFASLDRVPRYTVAISKNGALRWDGQHRVSSRGQHEGRTSPQLVAALWDLLARMGWFERQDAHGQSCQAPDERGDLFDVRAGGRERMLRDREGCRGGFSERELAVLRQAVEHVAGVASWIADPALTPTAMTSRRETEYWVVAAE